MVGCWNMPKLLIPRGEVELSVGTMLAGHHGPQEAFGTGEKKLQKRTYQCVTCFKGFSAPSKLQRHNLIHTGQRPFRCHLCEKAFRQLGHLKLHLNTHSSPIQKMVSVGPDLHQFGIENISPKETDNSNTCLQKDSSDTVIAKGTLGVSISPTACEDTLQESSLSSSYCISEFKPLISLHSEANSSGMQHREEEPLKGKNLSESGKQAKDVDSSLREKTVKKHGNMIEKSNFSRTVHKCPECFKCFSSPSKLKRHCLIHTGQRPFQCNICWRAFRQLAHLKAHYSVHTGSVKRKTLPLPQHSFKSQPQRSQTWLRNYSCNTCGRRFRQMRHLIVHQQTHKVPETVVHLGKLNDKTVAYPLPHIDYAPQVTPDSLKSVTHKIELNRKGQPDSHIDLTHSDVPDSKNKSSKEVKGNRCMVCLKVFDFPSKLSRHLLVHIGIKPYKCQVCWKSFRQLCHLQGHQKIHKGKIFFNDPKRTKGLSEKPGIIPALDKPVSEVKRRSVGSFRSQHIQPIKPIFGHCSSDSRYNHDVHSPAWDHSGNLLPGLDCKEVARHSFGESIPLRQGHNSTENTSGVFDTTPVHQSPTGNTKQTKELSEKKPPTHSRERGYCCSVCSKLFDAPSKLQRHSLTHTGQRSYQCTACPKTFRQKAHLKTHQTVHKQGTELLSRQEDSQFLKEDKLCTSHTEDRETELLSRPDVSQGSNEDYFVPNQSESLYLSNDSDLSAVPATSSSAIINSFDSQSVASVSQRKSGGHQCMMCLKNFDFPSKLSRHLLVHMGIKPFRCQVCSKSFRQLCHLQSHQKVHNKAMWHGGQQREDDCVLTQQDNVASNEGSVSEEHLFAGALHPDEPPPNQTFGDQVRNGQLYESNDGEPYSHYCSIGSSNSSENFNLSSNFKSDLSAKPENLKPDCQVGLDQKCVLPLPKQEKSPWTIAVEKPGETSSSGEHEQQNHPQFQNMLSPYPHQQETSDNEQTYPIASHHVIHLEDEHSMPESHDRPDDVDNKLSLYQSPQTSESNVDYGVKEERVEVRLRSELTVTYSSEPPNDLHVCPDCSQCFSTKRKLFLHRCPEKHYEKERQASSYQCAICFKSFEAPSKLKRHYLIHTGQRPFQCTVCEKTFTQSGHLKTHTQTHR